MFQVVEEFVGRGISLVQVPGEGLVEDGVEAVVNAIVEGSEIGDGQFEDAPSGFLGLGCLEDVVTEQEMGQDDAGGEEVGPLVRFLKAGLFGAHEIGLASDDFAFLIGEIPAGFGDAEIGEFHIAFEGDEDVFEADVAVDDAEGATVPVGFGVGIGQAACDPADDENGQFFGQATSPEGVLLGELLEVDAADEFHGNEVNAVSFAEVIGLDDVGVDEIGHQFGFADEIGDELGLAGVLLADDLDGHPLGEAVGTVLFGLVHDAHPALGEFAHDFVAAIRLDGEQRHKGMVAHGGSESSRLPEGRGQRWVAGAFQGPGGAVGGKRAFCGPVAAHPKTAAAVEAARGREGRLVDAVWLWGPQEGMGLTCSGACVPADLGLTRRTG